MKNYFLLALCCIFGNLGVYGQGEAANWFFGNRAGLRFNADNSITVLSTPENPIQIVTNEGCSSMSDAFGNLLLYTDGRTVWDRNHLVMPNGNFTLLGDPSSTQSGIIVPNPVDQNIYYVFTVDEPHHENAAVYPNRFSGNYSDGGTIPNDDDGFNNGFNYSTVDFSVSGSNGSIGDVISLNNHLVTYDTDALGEEIKYKCSEKITAVKTRNGNGYWVVTHFVDKFYAFKVDGTGVNTTPVVTQITPFIPVTGYRRNAIGQIKISPDGKKLAIAHQQQSTVAGSSTPDGFVYLYDFDNQTGMVSNPVMLIDNFNPYGIEFSPQGKNIYITSTAGLHQINIEDLSLPISMTMLQNGNVGASLQLGPDGKIYKANLNSNRIDLISNPEITGVGCDYQPNAVNLGTGRSLFGLPPFITSIFNSAITAENFCLGDMTNFTVQSNGTVDSVIWDFGDGNTSTSLNPSHQYLSPGNYTISVDLVVEGVAINNTKNIIIYQPPTVTSVTLEQCSPTNVETGIIFPLNNAIELLTGSDNNLSVTFFNDVLNATNLTNAISTQFTNTANPQKIYARVTHNNSGCFVISEVNLQVNVFNYPTIVTQKCDDSTEDGLTNFNLSEITFPVPGTAVFYANLSDAFLQQFPLNTAFTNTITNSQIIYAQISSGTSCNAIFTVELKVLPLPQIESSDEKYFCTNIPNFTLPLHSGIPANQVANYRFEWSTGETTASINAPNPGIYSVEIFNVNNCSKTRTINVIPSNAAIIQNIEIEDLSDNNTVTIILANTSIGDYEYSLDAPTGPFQESNIFTDVAPGFHTVYVNDINRCGVSQQEISVVKIPKFFTPNQDGFNDTWNIIGVNADFFSNSKIYIFDRFGKLLADIDPKGPGWNGVINGRNLPSTDYWYLVKLDDGRVIRGHFSLIR
ncbi:T9SS type B sorting domain-containing protein [Flavobacterium sp. NST-5]|uniref:T9SS type B sorting domain-containing protein n=1 Tax=Flavobacterium ichthyis TaxID=2698827 RepID=A0ABW9Z9C2_9FLAO|nr:T9SS type B sorting domain-containing protein [Flavobacterium ichthyis]NBL65289.1 T9SS type B sorting domain-containing protein [Flavobacterium ichthyis]